METNVRNKRKLHWALYASSLGNYFFSEISELIGAGLQELGHTVEFRDERSGYAKKADWHLVIAPHEFYQLGAGEALSKQTGPANLILFNTEQPSTQWFAIAAKHFPRAAAVWDIDYESSLRIQKTGYRCDFLPLGYTAKTSIFQTIAQLPKHEGTKSIAPEIAARSFFSEPLIHRPFDVLFLGHSSPRREHFFSRHSASLARFNNYFHKSNVARPLIPGQTTNMNTATSIGLAQRSKVLLNVHHGVDIYFEWHRIVLLGIAQRTLVVSEPCNLAPPFRANVDFVEAALNELPERIEYHLRSEAGQREAQQMIDHAFDTLTRRCRIEDALAPLIEKLIDSAAPEPIHSLLPLTEMPRRSSRQSDRPLSICVVATGLESAGRQTESGVAQVALAETLASAGHKVTLLHAHANSGKGHSMGFWTQYCLAKGIRYVALPSDPLVQIDAPLAQIHSYEVYRWLKSHRFNVVHFPETQGIGFYSLLARRQGLEFSETILSVRVHGLNIWWRQAHKEYLNQLSDLEIDFMERECVRLADLLTAPTPSILDRIKQQSLPLTSTPEILPDPVPEASPVTDLSSKAAQNGTGATQSAAERSAIEAAWITWHDALVLPSKVESTAPLLPPNPPLVSVCLVHYNRPEYLRQAITSLEAQDYPNFEVVLVDDGSNKPEAIEYLTELKSVFGKRGWQLIRQENRYLGAARNNAARNARGEYLLFMDDDNYAKPEEISTFVRVALKTQADILTTSMELFTGNKAPDLKHPPKARWLFLGGAAAVGAFRNCFGDANALIRRDVFQRVGGFTEDYGITHEDWEFHARAVLQGCRMETIPEPLFWYRYTPGSMIHSTSVFSNHQRSLRPYLAVVPEPLRELLPFAQGQKFQIDELGGVEGSQKFTRRLLRTILDTGKWLASTNQWEAADRIFMQLLDCGKDIQNHKLLLDALLSTGKTLAELGRREPAAKLLERALKLARQLRDPESEECARAILHAISTNGDITAVCSKIKLPGEESADIESDSAEEISVVHKSPLTPTLNQSRPESKSGLEAAKPIRKVGFLSFEPHDFACPFLRLQSPLQHLHSQGALELVDLGEARDGQFNLNEAKLKSVDVIVVQRQMAAILPYSDLKKRLAGHNAKIVFEIDDALTLLPSWHRASTAFQKIQPQIEEYLRQSDLVTVSTPRLKSLYGSFNRNVVVLPNSVDTKVWPASPPEKRRENKIRILFSGTLDHERDLRIVESALLQLITTYPDQIEFLYWGNVTEKLRALPQVRPAHDFKPSYPEYAALLQKLTVSFAIVPLEDLEFNSAKSPIKWLEYSTCGIPGIFSDAPAYNQTVEHNGNGLLVANTHEAWLSAMTSLVENPALREQLAARARETVLARHTVDKNAQLWLDAYESLFAAAPKKSTAPQVSVVIPVFNQIELTRRCLQAIRENTSTTFEVIVVDNGSTAGVAEFLKAEEAAHGIRVLRNETNLGFARACNQGARAARAGNILFLNNDTEVQPNWIEPLLRLLEADPDIAAVGSKLLFPDGTIQHAGVALAKVEGRDPLMAAHAFYKVSADLPAANHRQIYQALTAACLLVRRSALDAVGGFDEEFLNGYEDVDLCLRFQERGWLSVYEPASVVVHHESQSGPERFQKVQENIRLLHKKWLGKTRLDLVIGQDGKAVPAETTRIRAYQRSIAAPLTSIVILAFNQLEHTRRCLESIDAHTPEPHEIILVDNGSTDGTAEFFSRWQTTHANCTVICNGSNRGFAAGNNQALSAARGEYVLLLNNDTVVTEGWLRIMLAVFATHPRAGIVGPRSNRILGKQLVETPGYRSLDELPSFAAQWAKEHAGQSRVANRVIGFCLLARRAVVDAIGGLDEQFGSGNFEDDDYCIRAGLAGFETRIADDSFVHHVGSATFNGARVDYKQAMLTNWTLFKRKWGIPAQLPPQMGYLTPEVLPAGTSLQIPLPDLKRSHKHSADRRWTDITLPGLSAAVAQGATRNPSSPAPLPACARVGKLDDARAALRNKNYQSAWEQVLAAIVQRPFHPEAWLLLAETALEAGDSSSARKCAEHARHLAPRWKATKLFLQKSFKGNARHEWLTLDNFAPLTSHLQPRLTVCVITKNEEQFLDQCLRSIKPIAAQIVVVDTGSTDRTIEIAQSHGAEVHSFNWCDDFSAARNAALQHVTGDWILMLDADEELTPDQHAALQAEIRNPRAIAYRLPLANVGQNDGVNYVPRLFRNAPGVFYYGRIHEQVFPSLMAYCKSWGLETSLGSARILHHGYSKELVKDRNKVGRNLHLLKLGLAERPDDMNLVMNLGLEMIRSGELSEGLAKYREAFRLISAQPPEEVVPELREVLLTQYTYQLCKIHESAEVISVLNSRLGKTGGLAASLHFALGLAYYEQRQFRDATEQMRQCIARRKQPALSPINTDILTSAPNHCLALSLIRLGDSAGADKAFAAALQEPGRTEEVKLDYAKFLEDQNRPVDALHQLHEIVAANSKNPAAWRLGGEIGLKRPDFFEFICDWTGEAIRYLPDDPVIIAQRAEALLLSQQTASAKPLWERACNGTRPPKALAALILCSAVECDPLPQTRNAAEETAASRAFVEWYQRLVSSGARQTIVRLNSKIDTLRQSLPTAAQLLESAIAEAEACSNS